MSNISIYIHIYLYIFHDCFENSREICIQYIFHDCPRLQQENAHVFFPLLAATGAASIAQYRLFSLQFCEKVILFVIVAKICNGKYKGLAIQYIFHDCFENSREICIQSIFHDCFEHSRGKCMKPHARHKCQIERSDVNVKDKCQI